MTIRWPLLKIPAPGAVVDNFRNGKFGNRLASIDIDTGRLAVVSGRIAGSAFVQPFATDPSSGIRLEGFQLPLWQEALASLRSASDAFPELPALAWDMALTDAGPLMIEANWAFSVEVIQAAYRRGIRREFERAFATVAPPAARRAAGS